MNVELIFAFHSHGIYLLEAKRTDLPNDAEKSAVYAWIYFDEEADKIEAFDFIAADCEDDIEYREFEQASISFDDSVCELSLKSGRVYALDRISPSEVPEDVVSRLSKFLTA